MKNARINLTNGRVNDKNIYFQPIFIGKGKLAIVFPAQEGEETDRIVYYSFERMLSLPESFQFLDAGAWYKALEKSRAERQANNAVKKTEKIETNVEEPNDDLPW